MPQVVNITWTLGRLEDELDHTDASLSAEGLTELAERFEAQTRPLVEALRQKNRAQRRRRTRLEAKRRHINRKLDKLVRKAGIRLDAHLERDHDHPDWRRHFATTPSEFARQAFTEQVRLMKGWLQALHPALADLAEPIAQGCALAEEIFLEETAINHAQKQLEGERAQTVAELTRLRDDLGRTLSKLGEDNGEERDYADSFFL